ncbi:hypothetical protein BDN72DRAFT_729242, partial [Pluteus cervinus]
LQAHRNSLAPVSKLPTELLSDVFLHLVTPNSSFERENGTTEPYTITWVCRRWRHIALALPRLWAKI